MMENSRSQSKTDTNKQAACDWYCNGCKDFLRFVGYCKARNIFINKYEVKR